MAVAVEGHGWKDAKSLDMVPLEGQKERKSAFAKRDVVQIAHALMSESEDGIRKSDLLKNEE